MQACAERGATEEGVTSRSAEIERRRRIAAWVASEVLPHEAQVRAWLSRSRVAPEDAEELVQEAYCRLATLESVDHIDRADAYFFSTVRNLLVRRLRRERVVAIEAIAEIDSYVDMSPSPEEQAGSRMDFERLNGCIAALSSRCAEIVRLRKIEGWSQREIATHLGMTENAVEKQIWLGVRTVRQAWAEADAKAAGRLEAFERGKRW